MANIVKENLISIKAKRAVDRFYGKTVTAEIEGRVSAES